MRIKFDFNYMGYRKMPENVGQYIIEIDFVPPIGTCVSAEDFMNENEIKEFIKAKEENDDIDWLEYFYVCNISLYKDDDGFYYCLGLFEDIPDNRDILEKINIL